MVRGLHIGMFLWLKFVHVRNHPVSAPKLWGAPRHWIVKRVHYLWYVQALAFDSTLPVLRDLLVSIYC